jgi:hypothetical protein
VILIVTQPEDTSAAQVARRLRQRGRTAVYLDPAAYPETDRLTVQLSSQGERITLARAGERLDLSAVTAVWFRRPGEPSVGERWGSVAVRGFAREECRTLIHNLWLLLGDRPWVPGPFPALQRAERKLHQLRTAREIGFEIPPTVVTNDPAELLAFHRRAGGPVVSKMLGCGLGLHLPQVARYSQPVTPRDLVHFQSLRAAPVIFQTAVPKQVEVRVTVVGERLFAAEIHSQANRRTRCDWRRYSRRRTPHRRHLLPPRIAQNCRELVARLGLCYGALDLVLTPEGHYVFLEINPGGQWAWIEELTDLPITEALCELLAGPAATPGESQPAPGGEDRP